jgi:hypothetical protein
LKSSLHPASLPQSGLSLHPSAVGGVVVREEDVVVVVVVVGLVGERLVDRPLDRLFPVRRV